MLVCEQPWTCLLCHPHTLQSFQFISTHAIQCKHLQTHKKLFFIFILCFCLLISFPSLFLYQRNFFHHRESNSRRGKRKVNAASSKNGIILLLIPQISFYILSSYSMKFQNQVRRMTLLIVYPTNIFLHSFLLFYIIYYQ